MHRIVVLGGGYTGVMATVSVAARTRRLAKDVQVTLVNASARFTERLRLHQVASGQQLARFQLPDLLAGTGVELVVGWVTGIDAASRTVRVSGEAGERTLGYDTLVYALGAVTDTAAVPGAAEHAHTLDGAPAAERLAAALNAPDARTVAVCGSGLTGVETAAEIAERHPDKTVLLLGREAPGSRFGRGAKAYLDAALERLGVRVRAGIEIVKVLPDSVELAGGESVGADVVVWTSGVRVAPLAADAGLATDERGRVVTDSSLRSVSHPEVYAVGDAAAVSQGYGVLHGTCQSGMPTAVHAAASIVRELTGRPARRFRFGYVHAPVSLGRRDAVIQFTHPDESPKRMYLTGRVAAWYKETVSSSPWPSFGRVSRRPGLGSLAWRRGGRYTR